MLANLFRKTKIISFFLGSVLCFICLVFYHNTTVDLFQNPFPILKDSLLKTTIISIGLSLLLLAEREQQSLKINPLHWLSMLLILFYLPQGSLSIRGLLLQFFLGVALYNISWINTSKNTARICFNLSIIFSCLVLFESLFVWFFLIPALFFLDQTTRKLKFIIAYLIPPFVIFIWTITAMHFLDLEYSIAGLGPIRFIGIQDFTFAELLFILLMLLVALFPMKNRVKKGIVPSVGVHFFLLIWFFMGLYASFFRSNTTLNPWELTFFPLLHLLGIFLEALTHRRAEVLTLFLIILKVAVLGYIYYSN